MSADKSALMVQQFMIRYQYKVWTCDNPLPYFIYKAESAAS